MRANRTHFTRRVDQPKPRVPKIFDRTGEDQDFDDANEFSETADDPQEAGHHSGRESEWSNRDD